MIKITAAALRRAAPNARADLAAAVVAAGPQMDKAGITKNALRVRHFLAQLCTETGGLRAVEESLTYTSAERIMKVWPTRFKTKAAAAPFVRQPKKLAIKVYGGRMGNAPAPSTDGWDYRGGGGFQTTGRAGYRALGFESNPEALRNPEVAIETAIREWTNRGCNALADANDLLAIRRAINLGNAKSKATPNGMAEAKQFLALATRAFPDPKPAAAANFVSEPDASPTGGDADFSEAPEAADTSSPVLAPSQAIYAFDPGLEQVQQLLIAAGYPVGEVDGRWGTMTRTALLGFKADWNATDLGADFPLDTSYGADVIAALRIFRRPVSIERATTTEKELKTAGDPAVSFLSAAKKWLFGLFGFGVVGGVTDNTDAVSKLEQAAGSYSRARAALEPLGGLKDFILSHWWLVAIGVSAVGYLWIRPKIRKLVETYQKGLRA